MSAFRFWAGFGSAVFFVGCGGGEADPGFVPVGDPRTGANGQGAGGSTSTSGVGGTKSIGASSSSSGATGSGVGSSSSGKAGSGGGPCAGKTGKPGTFTTTV